MPKSPAQIRYEEYRKKRTTLPPWHDLTPVQRATWEHVASAEPTDERKHRRGHLDPLRASNKPKGE